MTEEVRELTAELTAVRNALEGTHRRLDALATQAETERGRSRRHRIGSVVLAVVVVVVVVLSWRDAAERDRLEHRTCVAGNETRADIRASVVETVLVIVERTEDPEALTPIVASVQDRLLDTIPDRPC